jgi:hypothetical protein
MAKIFLYLVFVFFSSFSLKAQQKLKRIQLNWDFFKLDQPTNAKHPAFTSYHFNLKTKLDKVVGNTLQLKFDVVFKLDTAKSYMELDRKHQDTDLLNHEQGHADIGILYARKLDLALRKAVFFQAGYNEKINRIFNEVNGFMLKASSKYDLETKYGTDKIEQNKWDAYFKKLL